MDSTDSSSEGTAVAEASPDSEALINGRYRIVKCVGTGGMGAVYLVRDTLEDDRLLALKQVRADKADEVTCALLRTEFLTLTELRHPNFAAVYDFGTNRHSGDLFYTSEYVDGIDWLTAMEALDLGQELAFKMFLALLVQALRGLEFMHSRRLVHCDIKPENILITGVTAWRTAVPQLKLIDFGLVKREKIRPGKKILGTPYYVAPETILGSPVDRRSDLYSLGVVLYHLVTGKPPFRGSSNLEILRGHVETEPVPPRSLVPSLSPRLSSIILRLIEKNPVDRFQGALEVIHVINRAFSTTFSLETEKTQQSYLEASWLVGRDREIKILERAFRECVGLSPIRDTTQSAAEQLDSDLLRDVDADAELAVPRGRVVLLHGEKGLGKQRLAEKLFYVAQTSGAHCLEVWCDEYRGPGVKEFQQLLRGLGMLGSSAEEAENTYLERAHAFAQTVAMRDPHLKSRGVQNGLQSVARGLLKLTREYPAVLFIHNLQCAGGLITRLVELLAQAQAEEWVSESRLLVVGTLLEQTEVERWEFQRLRKKQAFRTLSLELALTRLDRGDVGLLIRRAFVGSRFPSGFVRRVHEESDGNTGVIMDILEFLLAGGHVQRLSAGWLLDKDYESIQIPGKVRRALRSSLAKLPQPTLHLAIALACLEHDLVVEVAAAVSGVPVRSTPRCLTQLKQDNIIKERVDSTGGGRYVFVHQSAKKLLYTRIAAGNRADIHNRIGSLLEDYYEREGDRRNKELAYHFLEAGNREKGVQYGLEAAREYAKESLPLQSIATYKRVLALSDPEDVELQRKLRWEIADLRLRVGDYKGVIELLRPFCVRGPSAERSGDETALYLQVARAHIRLGAFEEAEALLAGRLEIEESHAGDRRLLVRLLIEYAVLAHSRGETVESLRFCQRAERAIEPATDVPAQIELLMLMAENHARLYAEDSAAGYCQQALRLIDAQHDADLLELSFFCRGKFYKYKHQYRNSLKQFQLCVMLRARMRMFDGKADCLLQLGALHLRLGVPQRAAPHLAKALAIYRRTGNLRGSAGTLALLGEVDRLTGQHETIEQRLKGALKRTANLKDQGIDQDVFMSYAGVCADQGDLGRAEEYLERVVDERMQRSFVGPAEIKATALRGEIAMWRGNYSEALKHCGHGLQIAREVRDPGYTANYLVQRCLLSCRLGRPGEARRSIASLMELAQRHELGRQEAWGRLIEGILLAHEERVGPAEKAFALATDLFISHGSERDMVALYLEYGLFMLALQDFEQSYLNLEEGFYLAKKLDLSYLKCRFFYARGLLEVSLPGAETARAEESFRLAANFSARGPYQEIRWQVHYQVSRLLKETSREVEAEKHVTVSRNSLQDVVASIPQEYRDSYLTLVPRDARVQPVPLASD